MRLYTRKKWMHFMPVEAVTHWIPARLQEKLFNWFSWWRIQIFWTDITSEIFLAISVYKPDFWFFFSFLYWDSCKSRSIFKYITLKISTRNTTSDFLSFYWETEYGIKLLCTSLEERARSEINEDFTKVHSRHLMLKQDVNEVFTGKRKHFEELNK